MLKRQRKETLMTEQEEPNFNSPILNKLCRKNDPYNEMDGILDSTCLFPENGEENVLRDSIVLFKMRFLFHNSLKTQDFSDLNNYIVYEGIKESRNGRTLKHERSEADAAEKARMVAKYINAEVKDGYAAKNIGDVLKTIIHAEPKLGLWSAAVVKKTKIDSPTAVPYALVDYFGNRFPEFLQSLQHDPLKDKEDMLQGKTNKERVEISKAWIKQAREKYGK